MTRRHYRQHCALARALDVVGERWTLLLVRELLLGPKRFGDLLANLEGIGTNLLAARLKELEAFGVVSRTEIAARVPAYALTELGRGLEASVVALGRFGQVFLSRPGDQELWRASWTPLALRYAFDPDAARGLESACEFRVDGEVFHARVRDQRLESGPGPDPTAPLRMVTDGATLLALSRGELTPGEASRAGRLEVTGELHELERFWRVFHAPSRPGSARLGSGGVLPQADEPGTDRGS